MKKQTFKILTLSEENKLSDEERKQYYINFRKYLSGRKLTNTTIGATTIAPKLKNGTNKICEIVTKALTCSNVEIVCEGIENIPDCPVILAQTHQGILDNFIWIPQVPMHCIILHHKDVSKILIVCQLNTGLVLIKKDDKENSANAKLDTIELLLKGHSMHWSPEGTYCLSPNKLHLPLRIGVIDAAKKSGAPIIPVSHEYTYEFINDKLTITKVHSKYGKPIYVKENDNLIEKLHEYEESISTLKYELIEAKGLFKRSDITNYDYINYLKQIYKDIETGKVDRDEERRKIYTADDDFHQFFHINDVPFNEVGEFLDTEEVRKIKLINQAQEMRKFQKQAENMHQKAEIEREKKLELYYGKTLSKL